MQPTLALGPGFQILSPRLCLFSERKSSQAHTRTHQPSQGRAALGHLGIWRHFIRWLWPSRLCSILEHKGQKDPKKSSRPIPNFVHEEIGNILHKSLNDLSKVTQGVSCQNRKLISWFFQLVICCDTKALLNFGFYFNKRMHTNIILKHKKAYEANEHLSAPASSLLILTLQRHPPSAAGGRRSPAPDGATCFWNLPHSLNSHPLPFGNFCHLHPTVF